VTSTLRAPSRRACAAFASASALVHFCEFRPWCAANRQVDVAFSWSLESTRPAARLDARHGSASSIDCLLVLSVGLQGCLPPISKLSEVCLSCVTICSHCPWRDHSARHKSDQPPACGCGCGGLACNALVMDEHMMGLCLPFSRLSRRLKQRRALFCRTHMLKETSSWPTTTCIQLPASQAVGDFPSRAKVCVIIGRV
jgi:hypothetical protein